MVKKQYNVIWDDVAKLELKDAYLYIKESSPKNALTARKNILQTAKDLQYNPFIYEADRFRKGNDGSFRAFEKNNYRVMYKIKETQVIILGVSQSSKSPNTHYNQ